MGVIDLKTCIQSIVAASPELVAKLGHDYTVYAYDFSEYETPLVGQGMLSWILASASSTPNAPAEQSKTMVTGRVCNNILGLFSNGIKETLEVKLKLVPVPTCLQREYVENMERYHSLSQVIPEGLDYNAWAEFLRTNPTISQLAHPNPEQYFQHMPLGSMGDDAMQQLLAQPMDMGDMAEQTHTEQSHMPYSTQTTRPCSPALSTISFSHYQPVQDSRPQSQASFRNEPMASAQFQPSDVGMSQDQQDDGPPKKRARVTKAARPRKAPLAAKNESLRVTASTAASVRLHRPATTASAVDGISLEQVPRAPTPRPGDRSLSQPRALQRSLAPSLLRNASIDPAPYDSAMFSDNAVDSADDERGNSPNETPMDIPSSPPVMPQHTTSSAPSSPGLPAMSYPADSGFVSDMPQGRDDHQKGSQTRAWDGSDLPTATDAKPSRKRRDNSHYPWTEVNPGPVELLPQSYVPKPRTVSRPRQTIEKMDRVVAEVPQSFRTKTSEEPHDRNADMAASFTGPQACDGGDRVDRTISAARLQVQDDRNSDRSTTSPSTLPRYHNQTQDSQKETTETNAGSPSEAVTALPVSNNNGVPQATARAMTPNPPPPKRPVPSKPRGLPRSQTWGPGEPMSDAISESGARLPRSGSGAKRKQYIAEKLEKSLAEGVMPQYCHHCGEIQTPTWRKAYTRVESGSPEDIQLSSAGNGIIGYEVMEPTEADDGQPKFRIFKQTLDQSEKDSNTFQPLNLCNRKYQRRLAGVCTNLSAACGLWLNKKNAMRPRELWFKGRSANPNGEKSKRKRNPPKGGPRKKSKSNDEIQSDAIIPHSEPVMPGGRTGQPQGYTDGTTDSYIFPSGEYQSFNSQKFGSADHSQMPNSTAITALHRAIQSSPATARLGTNRDTPIDVDPDLTPRPTRRILFPSPRKSGETKSLSDSGLSASPKPRSRAFEPTAPPLRLPTLEEETDKENCPPPTEHDDLAHLFEDDISPNKTPTKAAPLTTDLLKTPTPGSRLRPALSPRRSSENSALGLTTPSRNILMTPNRSNRAATIAPETPFTRQLNALLSDAMACSPSQHMDFSLFSNFNMTPGGRSATATATAAQVAQFGDYLTEDFLLSSDMPVPSSPPGGGCDGLGFSLYEDPETATEGGGGLWSGASIFDSEGGLVGEQGQGDGDGMVVKTTEITVDFAALIGGVVGQGNNIADEEEENIELSGTGGAAATTVAE